MEVDVIRSMDNPERLVCQTARGDYFDGYVGDTKYRILMGSVDYDDEHVRRAKEIRDLDEEKSEGFWKTEAATLAFIEKQLSRGHYGPWEHPQISFAVKRVSRVTMAQITRHRHLTFDVQSQRYVDFSDKETVVPKSLNDPDHFARETGEVGLDDEEREEALERFREATEESMETYEELVDLGVPKEDARYALPIGTPVNFTMSGNARTMMHVLNLRQKANAQWEIRELSEEIVSYLEDWMPYTGNWWRENGPVKISP